MKNLLKLLGVVLVASFFMVSCGEDEELIKKGGTIEVTNGYNSIISVVIVKGTDYTSALAELNNNGGTPILAGEKVSFKFDEDGLYTVCALAVAVTQPTPQPVTLALGSTKKITIQP